MKKLLFVLVCAGAFHANAAKMDFLVLSEDAVLNSLIFKDYRGKMKKFMEKFEEKKKAVERKLTKMIADVEKMKQGPERTRKEEEVRKMAKFYDEKITKLAKAVEAENKNVSERVGKVVNDILANVSAAHGSKPIIREQVFAYLPVGCDNVTSEVVETLNKNHKNVSISLPMINID